MPTPRTVHYSRPTSGTIAGGRQLFGADVLASGAAAAGLAHGVPLGGAGQGAAQAGGALAHGVPLAAAAAAQAAAVIALAKSAPLAAAAQAAGAAAAALDVSGGGGGGQPEAPTSGLTTFTVTSANAGQQPFTVGHAFKQGDIPSGQTLTGLQCDVRTRWPDNSIRFAVLSGFATLTSNIPRTVGCQIGTALGGSNVAEPSFAAGSTQVAFTSVTSSSGGSVGGGSFTADLNTARTNGSGAWSRTTARKVREILGPVMSEFHYFCPTADDHTHVWWYVRAYSGGLIEVETVVENGWLQVASPDRRNYNVEVTVGGTSRYTTSALAHYHHTRWSRVDWIGTDPAITPKHDVAYFQRTNLVPTLAVSTLNSAAYSTRPENGTKHNSWTQALAERPTPFSLANIDPALGSGGDTDMYGIVPGWGATYLAEGNAGAFWSCVANARAIGHFCLHYRDESDGRPFRGSAYTTLGVNTSNSGLAEAQGFATSTPAPAGGVPSPEWYFSHSPAAYFTAALLTGRWQFIEGGQFVVGAAELQSGMTWGSYRVNGWWEQNRYIGWKMRDRVQAELLTASEFGGAAVSGADANQRTEAVGRVTASVDMTYDYYVSGSSTSNPSWARGNAFGVPFQNADFDFYGANNDGEYGYGGLQNGIYTLGFLYAFDAEPSVTSGTTTKLQGLAEHFGKFTSGLLGAQPNGSNWDWRVFGFVTQTFGTPGALTSGGDANETTQSYRASWNANWTRITNGVAPFNFNPTPPQSLPADNILRKVRENGGVELTFSTLTTFPTDTDVTTLMWSANYMHKVADRATISGSDTAIGRLLGSDTWLEGLGNLMLTRPEFAVKTDRFLPNWVPATVGETALVPMTNTLSSVSLRSTLPGDAKGADDTEFYDFSGGVFNPHYGLWGGHIVHGGGHSATDDNSVFVANLTTLQWERVSNPVVLSSYSDYDVRVRTGAPPDSFADTPTANPREISSGVPGSAHTYDMMAILPPSLVGGTKGALIRPGGSAIGRQASREGGWAHKFDFDTNVWSRFSTTGRDMGGFVGGSCALDTSRSRVWIQSSGNVLAGYIDAATGVWTTNGTASLPNSYPDSVWSCYVAHRDIILIATRDAGETIARFFYYAASGNGETRTLVTFASGSMPGSYTGTLVYVPETQKVIFWTSGDQDNYHEIDVPATLTDNWTRTVKPITGAYKPSLLSPTYSAWVYKRMDYAPQLKSLIWVTGGQEGAASTTGRIVCIRVVPGVSTFYSTTFDTAETPISESGRWVKQTPEGGTSDHDGWHGMITTGGTARPRYNSGPTGGGPGSGDYDDCYAYLTGSWPTDLRAEGTIYRGAGNKEIELLFRVSDQASPARVWAYECLFDLGVGSVEIARWDGPPDGYVTLAQGFPGTYADGDRIAATITGTNPVVVTCYRAPAADPTNWTQILTYSDSSASRLTTGAPGIGAFCRENASNPSLDYGLKDYSVRQI